MVPSSHSPPKRRSYSAFYLSLIATTLGLGVPIVAVNVIIDPYDVFRSPIQSGFNNLRPRKIRNSRLFKPIHASQADYDVLLIGTSRMERGVKAEAPAFEASNRKAYNLAMNGQRMAETVVYAEHAIATNPNLKTMILGLKYWTFLYQFSKVLHQPELC